MSGPFSIGISVQELFDAKNKLENVAYPIGVYLVVLSCGIYFILLLSALFPTCHKLFYLMCCRESTSNKENLNSSAKFWRKGQVLVLLSDSDFYKFLL